MKNKAKKIIAFVMIMGFSQISMAADLSSLIKEIRSLRAHFSQQVASAEDGNEYRSAVQLADYMDTLEMEALASTRSLDEIEKDLNNIKAAGVLKIN